MGDGGEKYCCVLLESGGYHGDGGTTERDGRGRLSAHICTHLHSMQIDIFTD